jgi:hypothetical protein
LKKSNNKVSQHKNKRAVKNKKRVKAKPHLSKFERKQAFLREQIIQQSLFKASQNI